MFELIVFFIQRSTFNIIIILPQIAQIALIFLATDSHGLFFTAAEWIVQAKINTNAEQQYQSVKICAIRG